MEKKKLKTEEKSHRSKISNLQLELNTIFEKNCVTIIYFFENLKNQTDAKSNSLRVVSSEQSRDINRDKKLEKLLNRENLNTHINTAKIVNLKPH